MNTPTLDDLDTATIDLIFALRDSLTDDGPSRLDFWSGRVTTALEAAAAGADNAGQAITIAARKLQIETLASKPSAAAKKIAAVIDRDYPAWAQHVDRNAVYIVALARVENTIRKTPKTEEEPTF